MDCAYHLPGLCDCGQTESMVQEELLTMPDPKPADWKPPASAEDEKQRFTAMLGEFLEEDDTPAPTPKVSPTPAPSGSTAPSAAPSQDIASVVRSVLADHEKEKGRDAAFENLTKEVAALKAPRRKKWWEPWTMFADS